MQTKKFSIAFGSLCYICKVHWQNAQCTSGKSLVVKRSCFCEVYEVSVRIYFTTGEKHL